MITTFYAILLLSATDGNVESWPDFLGAGASQEVAADSIPVEWTPTKNIAWTADLPGYGQSSPVIWSDRVFLTCVEGPLKDTNHVVALQLSDGQQIWKHSSESSDKVESSLYVSRAAPTPVVDSERVIAFFESGDLIALDHQGNVLWQRSLSNENGKFKNRFGLGASPVQDDSTIFLVIDHEGPSYVLAIRKQNGATIWKQERKSRVSWSSPALLKINGQPQLVISSSGTVDGYDPTTGDRLWTTEDVGGNTAATPTSAGDGQFLVGASPGPRGETAAAAAKSNVLMKVSDVDGKPQVSKAWQAGKALSSFGSPVVYHGYAYWVNRSGVVFCFDVATGKEAYSERLAESCWATPLGIGDRVYFFGRKGETTVIAAGPEFKKLATNQLWEETAAEAPAGGQRGGGDFGGRTQYGAALVSGNLLVRTGDRLYCLRNIE